MPEWKKEIARRLEGLRLEPTREAEITEELTQHLDDRYAELQALGATQFEAFHAALTELSDNKVLARELRRVEPAIIQEPVTLGANRRSNMLGNLFLDLRYALRMLRKSPGFTAVALLSLGLGIGANTAIFSSVNALLLHPFDFRDLDRLVAVSATLPQRDAEFYPMTAADFADLRNQQTVFEELAAYRQSNSNLTGGGEPERVQTFEVSADYFKLLGVEAAFGRTFLPEEEQPGRNRVIVLSHNLWQRRFGGDPGVIGATSSLDEMNFTVIGVMPPGFDFPKPAELWTPLALDNEAWNDRKEQNLAVLARLKSGVELEQANAEMGALSGRLAEQYPLTNTGRGGFVRSLRDRFSSAYDAQFLSLLMAAVGFVLLIVCVNLANMELARATARSREIAIRTALGAARARIVRQLLTESAVLALFGGVLGLAISFWLLAFIRDSIPADQIRYIYGWNKIGISQQALVFNLAISLLSGIIFGLAPALQFSKPNVSEALKEGGRGSGAGRASQRLRKALIVSEIALALVLLVGAGLMVRGFARLTDNQKKGFEPRNVLTLRTTLPRSRYPEGHQITGFYLQALDRLSAIPGVESATSVSSLPAGDNWDTREVHLEAQASPAPGEKRIVTYQKTAVDLFRTLRIPIIAGRDFSAGDGEHAPRVAVVSQTLARRYWPSEDPIGRQIKPGPETSESPWLTIVGVVGDVPRFMFDREPQPTLYVPLAQNPEADMWFALRTSGEPTRAIAAVRSQLASLDEKLPLYEIMSHEQVIDGELAGLKLAARLMGMFGAMALLLSAIGVYGVMAYGVSQRTHEIGVRMALGAEPRDVLKLIVGQSLKLAGFGLSLGLPIAFGLGRLMASALFGVVSLDWSTFAGFGLLLAGVAVLSGYLPARRAARVDPTVALRYE